MVDPHLQERFARRCTDAAFGYTAAATAAYAAFADQVFSFWADVFATPEQKSKPKTATSAFGFPVPVPARQEPSSNPFMPFFWPMVPQPQSTWTSFPLAGFPLSAFPMPGFPFAAPASQSHHPSAYQNPFQVWLGMFPMPASMTASMPPPMAPSMIWPMAFMMIASGVPRSVAWPTAEANAAALDAADAAAVTVRQVFSRYHTDGGHAASHQTWPTQTWPAQTWPTQAWPSSDQLMLLATLLPLSFGALLASLRVA